MARDRRLIVQGGVYHVMNRGNRKLRIFEDAVDRKRFLRIWSEQQEVFGIETLGGTLMDNHFHDVVRTPHGNLSEFMQQVQGQYASYSNLTALSYVFLNPVVARLCDRLEDYVWSTYAATVGLAPSPDYLCLDWLSGLFPAPTIQESQTRLIRTMNDADPVSGYLQESELNVAPETIRRVIHSYTGARVEYGSMPRMYRTALRPSLEDLLREYAERDERFVYDARVIYGYTNVEIAKVLDLHPATISKMFRIRQRILRAA